MKRDATMTTPTTQLFDAYQAMFDHFNVALWEGKLPQAILNLSRFRGAYGVFISSRWAQQSAPVMHRQGGRCRRPVTIPAGHWSNGQRDTRNEISLNPDFTNRDPRDIAGTLVHEMAHHWQACFGKPGKGAYHNKQWAEEMKRVGLQPVSMDQPGAETGCKVSHRIVDGAAFAAAFDVLPEKAMPWAVAAPRLAPSNGAAPVSGRAGGKARNKRTYLCGCGNKVWGKPGLAIHCEECDGDYVEQQ